MSLTNKELQDIVGKEIVSVDKDNKMDKAEKAKAIVRLGSIHIRCTRAEVYGHNAASKMGKASASVLSTKLRMPVFK